MRPLFLFLLLLTLTVACHGQTLTYKVSSVTDITVSSSAMRLGFDNHNLTITPVGYKPSIKKLNDTDFGVDMVLTAKPSTTTFHFKIDGWENYDFFYQPPLSEKDPCRSENGKSYRPENVVGSYAVYHKTLRDNQYMTGKLCHIYRPKFIDADGKWTWGVLNFDRGDLTVSCTSQFLKNARYPVTVDPDVGYGAIGGTTDENNANYSYCIWYPVPVLSAGQTVALSSFAIVSYNNGNNLKCALYTNNTGGLDPADWTPLNLIANTTSAEGTSDSGSTAVWVGMTVAGGATLTQGTTIWLTCCMENNAQRSRYDSGRSQSWGWGSTAFATFPPAEYPDTSAGKNSGYVSFHFTYSIGGGEPPAPAVIAPGRIPRRFNGGFNEGMNGGFN